MAIGLPNTQFARRPQKYNNVRTVIDGFNFSSKAEARYYESLKAMKQAGAISYFLMQVPFHIAGAPKGIRYVLDFAVFYPDGKIKYIDVKGMETQVFKLKRAIVQERFGITIETVR